MDSQERRNAKHEHAGRRRHIVPRHDRLGPAFEVAGEVLLRGPDHLHHGRHWIHGQDTHREAFEVSGLLPVSVSADRVSGRPMAGIFVGD